MHTDEQKAVKSAVSIFRGTQGSLDREYEERQRRSVIMGGNTNDRKTLPRRFYSQRQVELNSERADQKLGPILAGFTQEQFAEYMRLTT